MTISVIGLNHKSASIGIREKFSFSGDCVLFVIKKDKKII
jgi:glutamyl-tRNA reductase